MLHSEAWLDVLDSGLSNLLRDVCRSGRVGFVGVSVYSLDAARHALELDVIDIIQVPCNIWDRRMQKDGIFELASAAGKLCFVRL